MRWLTLLLAVPLMGCLPITAPVKMAMETRIFSVSSSVNDSTIMLGATGEGTFQAYFDSDMNASTGYAGGYDYVLRAVEAEGDSIPIRNMDMVESNPGGWGRVVGWGRRVSRDTYSRVFSAPRSIIQSHGKVRYRIEWSGANGEYKYVDGVTKY